MTCLDFRGVASQKEFRKAMMFVLSVLLAFSCILVLLFIINHPDPHGYYGACFMTVLILMLAFTAIMFVPTLAVTSRRLHDFGGKTWWMVIPAVLLVVSFFFFFENAFANMDGAASSVPAAVRFASYVLTTLTSVFFLAILLLRPSKGTTDSES